MSQPTELFDLTGKVAIVTGSTKGLGRDDDASVVKVYADIAGIELPKKKG